jgi:putative DNA methylase
MVHEPASGAVATASPSVTSGSRLDAGALPLDGLAAVARREGRRPRPIYEAHRWFARRFASAFRALLTAAATPCDAPFWPAYYEGGTWQGRTVLDPFVGGGTSVVEARRLGATAIGVDLDPLAAWITRFEVNADALPDLTPVLQRLRASVGARLADRYRTLGPAGEPRVMLHAFWVQHVRCEGCSTDIACHPTWRLAWEAEGTRQWAICRHCGEVHEGPRGDLGWVCHTCGGQTLEADAPVRRGTVTCPICSRREPLIRAGRRTGRPRWELFALETLPERADHELRAVPLRERRFQAASATDRTHAMGFDAEVELARAGLALPDEPAPADDRLTSYGYRRYTDLFLPRQLLHLGHTAAAILAEPDDPIREALTLAFSHHLATNCALTSYAFGWRRLAPLFAVRAYRHVPRPVELNPWLMGTGRGTFPNAVRGVNRAARFARDPMEPCVDGTFRRVQDTAAPAARVEVGDARALPYVGDRTVDLVLTDPPYFDYIAYQSLADFYRPWLRHLGLSMDRPHQSVAAPDRSDASGEMFAADMASCFREAARALKPEGRLVFTFQHRAPAAWAALGAALGRAGLLPVRCFPLLGDIEVGLHHKEGRSLWDAVLVLAPGGEAREPSCDLPDMEQASSEAAAWRQQLGGLEGTSFRGPDERNLAFASLTLRALAVTERSPEAVPLAEALRQIEATLRRG